MVVIRVLHGAAERIDLRILAMSPTQRGGHLIGPKPRDRWVPLDLRHKVGERLEAAQPRPGYPRQVLSIQSLIKEQKLEQTLTRQRRQWLLEKRTR